MRGAGMDRQGISPRGRRSPGAFGTRRAGRNRRRSCRAGSGARRHDAQTDKFSWMAAILLVIPGFTLIGTGLGLALDAPAPWTTVGLGAGLAVWGLVVALRRPR